MVPVLISLDFLVFFQKFDSYTIADFRGSSEIDLESFLFIKQLLFTAKSEWFLNISSERILELREKNIAEIPLEFQDAAMIIKTHHSNIIYSNILLYSKIQQHDFSTIDKLSLPPYIFLGNADISFCNILEEELGVNVFSIGNSKIKEHRRRVVFKIIKNTNKDLFDELNTIAFNKIKIEDQYFSQNFQPFLKTDKPLIKKKSLCLLRILTNNSKGGFDLIKQNTHLKKISSPECITRIENGSGHDRFIYTNTAIICLGNSLLVNTPCTYAQYPIGIYSSDFFER